MIAAVILIFLFVLLTVGAPVSFALMLSGTAGVYWFGGFDAVVGTLTSLAKANASKYEFLAIPMFLLMAEFVLRSGIAEDLFRASAAWVGRVRGGLGIATALAGAGFGAVCGSSTASAATLSSTSLPAMISYGYDNRIASGVVAISGTLAMLIPPSIIMIIYALLADISVAHMLIAGVVPAIIVTGTIVATVMFLAIRNPDEAPLSDKVSWREKFTLLRPVAPMLVLMMAVTGVIYSGIATPTEASAVGALCAGILFVIRRRPNRAEAFNVFARATRTACMISFILLGAHIFTTFFALTQTTQSIILWVAALEVNRWLIIVALMVVVLILGCFMDQMAILVLTVPITVPLIQSLGFDPIWFGVVMIIAAEVGLVTPPLGLNCFVVSKYAKIPVQIVFRGVGPHVVAHLVALAIMIAFPVLSLWLPSLM